MKFINTIYVLIKQNLSHLHSIYKHLSLINRNKTCKISIDSVLDNTTFGNYVGIFGSPMIINSEIGDYSYIQTNSRIINCKIGKFCSIGANVTTAPGKHALNFISTSPCFLYNNTIVPKCFNLKDKYDYNQKVIIENDVWIGEGALILEGVTIKTGAIVGAHAVVTKDVEPYAIVGGVPAKLIRYRFSKEVIDRLLESKWWDHKEDWFIKNFELFRDSNLSNDLLHKLFL